MHSNTKMNTSKPHSQASQIAHPPWPWGLTGPKQLRINGRVVKAMACVT